MRIYVALGITALGAAAPAAAKDGHPYIGVDLGSMVGRDNDIDEFLDASGQNPPGVEYDDAFSFGYKRGEDVDLVGGYDFGMLRLEMELGYKRARLDRAVADDSTIAFLGAANSALNLPSGSGLPALAPRDFDLDGRMSVRSAMVNGLLDVGLIKNLSIYGGGGVGRSDAKALGDEDGAWAWQWLVGARYAVGSNVELGLKFRYFNSGVLKLRHEPMALAGSDTPDVLVTPEIEGRFRSRSLLASLIYNF